MDGIEVLANIKESGRDGRRIVTGYQTVETAVKAIKLGLSTTSKSPYPDTLIATVSNVFRIRKSKVCTAARHTACSIIRRQSWK